MDKQPKRFTVKRMSKFKSLNRVQLFMFLWNNGLDPHIIFTLYDQDVNGQKLSQMDETDIKGIGLWQLGYRMRIRRTLKGLEKDK